MSNKMNTDPFEVELIKDTLFELFGKNFLTIDFDGWGDTKYYQSLTDKMIIKIVERKGNILFSVDLRKYFDKPSKCPLNFLIKDCKKLSKRKLDRIREAYQFLLKEESHEWYDLFGFDDLSSGDVQRKFYSLY